ncbi:MAG: DUF2147 domain-containing protein [Treponemataceae bacterium]
MIKKALFIVFCLFGGLVFSLSSADIVGIWYLPKDKNGNIPVAEIFEKDGKFYAVGFIFQDLVVSDAKDVNNTDVRLQNRLMREVIIVNEIEIIKNNLANGEIYNPENGKYFFLRGSLSEEKNTISWRATTDKTGLFGVNIVWTKSPDPKRYESYRLSREKREAIIPTTRMKK